MKSLQRINSLLKFLVLPILALSALSAGFLSASALPVDERAQASGVKASSLREVVVPNLGKSVKFTHRQSMRMRSTPNRFKAPSLGLPATVLPVDSTGKQTVSCPMDGNDSLGDCGEAMACHADNIFTFRQGKGTETIFGLSALENQYLTVSGGDNGLDEDMVVNQIWRVGLASVPQAVIVDSLDIDVTNVALTQYAIDQFYTVQMAWSVPDAFLNQFATGVQFFKPMRPDPANGHFVPLADVDSAGNYTLYTWGTYCFVSPSFVASVQPQCFVVFSPRMYDPATGLDSKGRHIATQAEKWVACGGNPVPSSVISAFPPVAGPVTPPAPIPTPQPQPAGNDLIIDPVKKTIILPSGWKVESQKNAA